MIYRDKARYSLRDAQSSGLPA